MELIMKAASGISAVEIDDMWLMPDAAREIVYFLQEMDSRACGLLLERRLGTMIELMDMAMASYKAAGSTESLRKAIREVAPK